MLKIMNRVLEENQIEKMENNIHLFYELYNKREDLTLKELKILRDFCYRLELVDYHKYSESLDELIEEKRFIKTQ